MAGERNPGPVCQVESPVAIDTGTMCVAETSTPGPAGVRAYRMAGAPNLDSPENAGDLSLAQQAGSAIIVGGGMGAVARIPIPGMPGLFIELRPRGWVPKSGSTSTVFIQDATGKRHLRLDYGYNKTTGKVDYHWNQKGTQAQFGITDHAPAGKGGAALYRGAKYFKYGGRILLVVGAAIDIYSIVVAKKRLRQVTKVVAGWTGAALGCEVIGAWGAGLGTVEPGGGNIVGAFVGCLAGGIGGYAGASWAAGETYDWIEETFFEPVPEEPAPR